MAFKRNSSRLQSTKLTFQFSSIKILSYGLILLVIVSLVPPDVQGIKLDSDGGYSILVGIDTFESEPDLENLILSIKDAFSSMSHRMSDATRRFYIKNVDILLQSHSDLVETDADAISENYKTADFHVSKNVLEPQVENPNGCGLPGSRLSLPLKSFDKPDGISVKTLLHLFAKYRWGVYEEDRSKYDAKRFPRFYRTTNEESSWVHTVCSNTRLVGSFEPSQDGETCDLTNLDEYPSTCEFMPSPSEEQTASSSLMNYYWLESITEFCNESTHNILAPNAQNILCGYRSVMVVITNTQDWSKAELPEVAPPEPKFRILGVSQKPRLYILLDRGWSFAPEETTTEVKQKFTEMMESLDTSIVLGIGAFPTNTPASDIDTLLEWSRLENVKSNVSELIDQNFENGMHGNGNFVTALYQITKSIQAIDHPFGTAIVILKTGTADSLENTPYEYDIISSLNALPIKVYALEMKGNDVLPGQNLANFVGKIGGACTAIDNSSTAAGKLDIFTRNIVEQFQTLNIPEKSIAQVFKGIVESGAYEHELGANLNTLEVSLTSSKPLRSVKISLNAVDIQTVKSAEWSDTSVNGKREVYYRSTSSEIGGTISVSFECGVEDDACATFLVVSGARDEINGEELISVEIFTSSQGNEVDWNEPATQIAPFHIYAKVSKSGDSMIEDINGVICPIKENPNDCQSIKMVDDGLGEPDVLKNDGIYSLTFMPRADDRYHIRVVCTVVKNEQRATLRTERTFDYNGVITFKGVSNFQPVVRRVVHLNVAARMEESVTLTWTSPVIHGINVEGSADKYELRCTTAKNYTSFLRNFEDYPEIPSMPNPAIPGTLETVTFDMNESEETFFAIRALYRTTEGEVSNIVSSAFASQTTDPPTTTEIPTTTSEDVSTTPEGPTTTPEDPSTTTKDPTTTPEDVSTTTEEASTTSEDVSTTTKDPTTTTEDVSTTTKDPTTTTEDVSTTTKDPTTTTEDVSTTSEEPTTSTEFSTASSVTVSASQSSTPSITRPSSTPSLTTPKHELFFKKPIGYITAAVGGVAVVAIIGGFVGYLYWKRKQLIDSGRLKLV